MAIRKGVTDVAKLKVLQKRFLDPDVRSFIKAGLLDNDLSVNDDGLQFLADFLFSKFKGELGEEVRSILKGKKKKDCESSCECGECGDCDEEDEKPSKK